MTTWSPTDKDDLATLSNGNLTVTGTDTVNGPMKAFATAGKASSAGKFYWEITVGLLKAGSAIIVGITGPSRSGRFNTPGKSDSLGIAWQSGGYNTANSTETYVPASAYTTGDKLGLALDTATGKLDCYKNGSLVWSATTAFASYLPFIAPFNNDNGTANFGASTAVNPPPSGYNFYDAASAGRSAAAASTLASVGGSASSRAAVAAVAAGVIGGVVSQAVGKVLAVAAGVAALQPIGATASAQLATRGASGVILGDVASSASGAPVPALGASVATTLAAIQSVATVQVAAVGTTASSLGQINSSSAGAAEIRAVGAASVGSIELAAVGRPAVTAVAAPPFAVIVNAATGGAQAGVVATSTSALAVITSSSTARVPIAGSTMASLGAISSSSGAVAPVRATAAAALGSVTGLAASRLELSAVSVAQFALLGSISAGYVVTRATASALLGAVGGSASAVSGGGEPSAGIAGACWTAIVRPRLFMAAVAPRQFTALSTGCKRMITFPGKYAHEVRHAAVDFAPSLASGEELVGAPIAEMARGDMIVSAASIDGSTVRFTLSGGSPLPSGPLRLRATHLISVRCATDAGQVLEELVSVGMLSG